MSLIGLKVGALLSFVAVCSLELYCCLQFLFLLLSTLWVCVLLYCAVVCFLHYGNVDLCCVVIFSIFLFCSALLCYVLFSSVLNEEYEFGEIGEVD